jgi:cobalt-zinc-cadmium efflux system protein
MEKIKAVAVKIDGIKEIHHIHIWAMSTTKNAMTAHLILENDLNENEVSDIKHEFKHQLQHLNIQHVTLETELIDCKDNC